MEIKLRLELSENHSNKLYETINHYKNYIDYVVYEADDTTNKYRYDLIFYNFFIFSEFATRCNQIINL